MYSDAKKTAEEAIERARKCRDTHLLAAAYLSLGNIGIESGLFEEAARRFAESEKR